MPCTNHRKVFQKTMHGINNSHDGNKSFPIQRKNPFIDFTCSSLFTIVPSFDLVVLFQLQNGSSKIVIGEGWFVPSFNRNTVNQRRMIDYFGLHHVSTADDKQVWELIQAFEAVRGGQLHWFLAWLIHVYQLLKCLKLGGEWHLKGEEIGQSSGGSLCLHVDTLRADAKQSEFQYAVRKALNEKEWAVLVGLKAAYWAAKEQLPINKNESLISLLAQ